MGLQHSTALSEKGKAIDMCLLINNNEHTVRWIRRRGTLCLYHVPIVLKEDIIAYKRIKRSGKALFTDFWYEPNTLYRKKRKLRPTQESVYGAGFHAFRVSTPYYTMRDSTIRISVKIPKGSTVFYGMNGDIVTNQIQTLDFPTT